MKEAFGPCIEFGMVDDESAGTLPQSTRSSISRIADMYDYRIMLLQNYQHLAAEPSKVTTAAKPSTLAVRQAP